MLEFFYELIKFFMDLLYFWNQYYMNILYIAMDKKSFGSYKYWKII